MEVKKVKMTNTENILKISLLLLSIIIICSFGINTTAAASTNSTIYVNTTGNDNYDGQLPVYDGNSGPKATITNATGTVADNGTIYIADGTYNENNININSNMTLIGESQTGTIINAQGQGDIFNITTGDTLNLINLTIENGNGDNGANGGAINNQGNLNLESCTFTNNSAFSGGAIENIGTLTVNTCTFTNNTATDVGGAIHNYQGIITITNSNFSGNNGKFRGGAIDSYLNTSTITNCTFTDNTGTNGGAVYNDENNLTIVSCTFTDNTATDGGAIYNVGGEYISIATITNDTFTNNTAYDAGGAINNYDGTLNVTNTTFTGNTASGGGAIYNNYYSMTVTGTNFTNNTAIYGGAINNQGVNNTFNCTSNTFTNNTATDGGAIYNYDGSINVTSNTFTNNNATDGGAICNYDTLNVTDTTFTGNTATYGSAVYNYGTAGTVNTNFSRIVNNSAPAIYNDGNMVDADDNWWGTNNPNFSQLIYGNANTTSWLILNNLTANPAIITNGETSTVNANLLSYNGTIYNPIIECVSIPINFNSTLGDMNPTVSTLINGQTTSIFTPNTLGTAIINATVDNQTVNTQIDIMGLDDVYVSPTGNDVTGNGSQANPYQTINMGLTWLNPNGTLHMDNGIYTGMGNYNININKDLTIIGDNQDNTIIDAQGLGNIFNINSGVTVTLENLTLTNGLNLYGGAINNQGTLNITNCTFTNNTATGNIADNPSGGAINNAGTLTVTSSNFNNNNAKLGGAISNTGSLTVTSSNFNNNTATDGGAIFSMGSLTVTSSNLNNNTANNDGGAIYCEIGIINVNFSRIVGNTASLGNAFYSNGLINATLNWWGSNNPDFNNLISGLVSTTPWIVLNITANPTTIPYGDNSTVTTNLLYDNQGNYHNPINGCVPSTPVSFTGSNGILNPVNTSIINGTGQSTFNANTPSAAYVNATVDGQTVTTNINILQIPTNTTLEALTNYAGHNVNLTAYVTDNDGNPVDEGLVKFTMDTLDSVTANLVNGTCYCNWTIPATWTAGNYNITANYMGTSNYTNSSDYNTLTVKPTAKVDLTIITSNVTPSMGEQYYYTVTAVNNGPDNATGVTVTDHIPFGLNFNTIQLSQGTYNNNTGIWDIGNITANSTVWLKIIVTPTSAMVNENIKNTANLTSQKEYNPLIPVTVNVNVKVTGVTLAQLEAAALTVKNYYETHHDTLPSTVTITGQKITMPQFLELLVTSTINLNKGKLNPLNITKVNPAPYSMGSFTIGKIYQPDYVIIAMHIQNFINTKGRAPNYAITSLGNVPFTKLVYSYSKIINFYGKNHRLPHYVNIT